MRTSAVIVCVVVAVAASFWFSLPIPEECSSSVKRWLGYSFFKLFVIMGTVCEDYLQVENCRLHLMRHMFATSLPKSAEDLSNEHVTIREVYLRGVHCLLNIPHKHTSDGTILYIHGGAWILGSAEHFIPFTREMSKDTGAIVVSVNYRLAPENIFPAAVDDVIEAYKGLVEKASDLGFNQEKIIVAGDSSGGNLAAALTLRLRDEKYPTLPLAQILVYPCLQTVDSDTPSYQLNSDDTIVRSHLLKDAMLFYATGSKKLKVEVYANNYVPKDVMEKIRRMYLNPSTLPGEMVPDFYKPSQIKDGNKKVWNELKDVVLSPYFSPLLSDDLRNLPPAVVFTVEKDVLRDEGVWYAQRLKTAGNQVKHINYIAGYHGILGELSSEFYTLVISEVKRTSGIDN